MSLEYFDRLETRSPAEREEALFCALRKSLPEAMRAPAIARSLEGIDPQAIQDRNDLARLPLIRKSDLSELQAKHPPFGGLAPLSIGEYASIFASPGPIFEPIDHRPDPFRTARALFAAGIRKGELVHNAFSYHFTPAGAMLESGAHALGCAVFPAGPGQSEIQVQTIARLRPSAWTGTPSFLLILLEKAATMGEDASSLEHALVSGEALPESLRAAIAEYRVETAQCYATADVGLIAYEAPIPGAGAPAGMILDEGIIAEIVRPGTGDPVPEGEVGEVVVTVLDSKWPLVRLATGDLSAVLPGVSPCGRTNTRIRGWMGRADQTTKVKGMFVHPSQIAQVAARHREILKARLVVTRDNHLDTMTLHYESEHRDQGVDEAICASLRDICKLRGETLACEPGSLPNDGKVIEDARTDE
ncbi:phenylacetate--CoA ligase family protein [Thioalkalivibrio sp. HK1]|uniref:phenylacetate--CoA ligase family protein n=1 Tax=Thioalkalivibrio sp. HK1 TaxID=1469245 RepID=UPI00046E7FA9|nr:AMP-binding protein [Thioalkalivibrio sp. HK1]